MPGLRGSFKPDEDWKRLEIPRAFSGRHVYCGPFFRASETRTVDDGYDGDRNSHMLDMSRYKAHDGVSGARADIFEYCKDAIRQCDFVFAWMDADDCFGTVYEIGMATAYGKKIYVAGPLLVNDDMWFPLVSCTRLWDFSSDTDTPAPLTDAFYQAVERFALADIPFRDGLD